MKVLKYVFLLLLLSIVSFSVFVATQKGNFKIERSKVIRSSKANLYSYLNDYQNWSDFMDFLQRDAHLKQEFSPKSAVLGSSYSWKGQKGNGVVQTSSLKENESISQKMTYDDSRYELTWKLKDTLGGTKVSISSVGEMSFSYKIYTFFRGGADRIIGTVFEQSLENLDQRLDLEIKTFAVDVKGLVTKKSAIYLSQNFSSKISSVIKNATIVFPKLMDFCKKNKIQQTGKPFLIYKTYDELHDLANVSYCIPIKEAIITTEGSDIICEKSEAFLAVKTSLTGDYSHLKQAMTKAVKYNVENKIALDNKFSHITVFSQGKPAVKYPSKWKTDIYFPIRPKKIIPKVVPKVQIIEEDKAVPEEIEKTTDI